MDTQATIDPELPWGYWLRMETDHMGTVYVDEGGRRWPSVREAFWTDRLGLKPVDERLRSEVLETMLALLTNKARGASADILQAHEIFEGNAQHHLLFELWLTRERLIEPSPPTNPFRGVLTAEGSSAMLMLAATRPQPIRGTRPDRRSVRELITLGLGPHPLETRMQEVEHVSQNWAASFTRARVGSQPTILLVKRDLDLPMPVTRTVWAQPCPNERVRDALYAWLCSHVDRWAAWSDIAFDESSAALTTHLLSLIAASAETDPTT